MTHPKKKKNYRPISLMNIDAKNKIKQTKFNNISERPFTVTKDLNIRLENLKLAYERAGIHWKQ
jgi:hypothetical protein